MRKGGGKEKGSDFERQVSKMLSTWWSGGSRDDLFWRNPAVSASRTKSRVESQHGDMHSISEEGAWFSRNVNVECKCYRDLDLLEIVDKPKKKVKLIFQHWEQCKRDAKASDRAPLLISKRNFGQPFVVCHVVLAQRLRVDYIMLRDRQGELVAVFSSEVLFTNTPPEFRRAIEEVYSGKAASG